MYILNAIPGSVIPQDGITLRFERVSEREAAKAIRQANRTDAGAVSAIGHQDTANIISLLLGEEVRMNRVSVPTLKDGDCNLMALYQGARLPEGATTLPEGATMAFYLMTATEN